MEMLLATPPLRGLFVIGLVFLACNTLPGASVPGPVLVPVPPGGGPEPGDVNLDTVLDEQDLYELQHLRGHPEDIGPLQLMAADLDRDSRITLADEVILREQLGLERFLRGDISNDRDADIVDLVALIRYLFGDLARPACPDAADVNDDGDIDLGDILRLGYALFTDTGVAPAAPFPRSGIDMSADGLGPCLADQEPHVVSAEDLLGPGAQRRTAGVGSLGGTLNLYQHAETGRAVYRLRTPGAYHRAAIAWVEVHAFSGPAGTGEVLCADTDADPRAEFDRGIISDNGVTFFDPSAHDNGALEEILADCGCDKAGVESVRIVVAIALKSLSGPSVVEVYDLRLDCPPVTH